MKTKFSPPDSPNTLPNLPRCSYTKSVLLVATLFLLSLLVFIPGYDSLRSLCQWPFEFSSLNSYFNFKLLSKNFDSEIEKSSSSKIGNFLHITDIHYDPLYFPDASVGNSCHLRKDLDKTQPLSSNGQASISKSPKNLLSLEFGTPYSRCDSPSILVESLSRFISFQLPINLDFVILTGDNCRHDSDSDFPMNGDQIFSQQEYVFSKLRDTFDNNLKIPLIFSLGNNDIYPHNKLGLPPKNEKAGRIFKHLYTLLSGNNQYNSSSDTPRSPWIDPSQEKVFLKGGYYSASIPSTPYRVISLNTMYFYVENSKVGGCKSRESPGLAQIGWLRSELKLAKKLGQKAIIIGHIAPHKDNYRNSCLKEYRRTVSKFTDTISAQMFGHTNRDAWFFVEPLKKKLHEPSLPTEPQTGWERRVDNGDFWWLYEDLVDEDLDDNPDEISNTDMKYQYNSFDPHHSGNPDQKASLKKQPDFSISQIDDFTNSLVDSYERVLDKYDDISRLSVASISHSVIPRFQPAFKILHYLKHTSLPQSSSLTTKKRLTSDNNASLQSNSGVLLDYSVYWLNLTLAHEEFGENINPNASLLNHPNNSLNEGDFPSFELLYTARNLWGIKNLTVSEYISWAKKLVENKHHDKRIYYKTSTIHKTIQQVL
ncbi:hypothetical protein BB560_005378 [Smittium megazygosporum]|uniref:Calcineurin-like phosphoesterase domain-containing protein n=1 Tax=Smittium megazygosporum TaxID=133381 RepID=A0A2T9Z6T3_9FUNG|nr:hypothetical protein BB560_005378 [Smittium megazygosporum]